MPRLRPAPFVAGILTIGTVTGAPIGRARADEPPRGDVPDDLAPLRLDTGRRRAPAPDPEAYRFTATGELQLRLQAQRTFPMTATPSAMNARPGLLEASHGQHWFGAQWLRLTPRFLARDDVAVVAQADVLTGTSMGELTRDVGADLTPRNEYDGYSNVQPRWLFAQLRIGPGSVVRVGQQPNHWGSGIVYNDGDHPMLFGDYRYGDISERLSLVVRPARHVVASVAADFVYRDDTARLTRGDHAFQEIATVAWEDGWDRIGLLGTLRHQDDDRHAGDATNTFLGDVHARVARRVPGDDAFVFAETEVATLLGSTTLGRTVERGDARTAIASYGGLATVGYVHRSWDAGSGGKLAFGDLVVQLETGYASGDADPYDHTQRRFTFDPNHRVGLLMFDEILRWQTARSATALLDPRFVDGTRAAAAQLASNGGVFAAEYLNPTVVVRPWRTLDLKAGAVIAQATADVVDPYRTAAFGSYQSYRGGTPKRRDLGLELDGGVEQRVALDYDLTLQIGAQGGLLFPGGALANAAGERLPPQWLAVARLGLQF